MSAAVYSGKEEGLSTRYIHEWFEWWMIRNSSMTPNPWWWGAERDEMHAAR